MNMQFPLVLKARVWVTGLASPNISFSETRMVAHAVGDESFLSKAITQYESETGKTVPTKPPAGGPITDFFQWLLEWASSEEGKAFIRFIFSLFGLIV